MAPPIPTGEPEQLVAGDTWKWQRSVPDYPATDGWTLSYALRGAASIDFDATPDGTGSGYTITVAAGKTAVLVEGTYEWVAWVANTAGERYTVGSGRVAVLANFAKLSGADRQHHVERALALIETQIEQLLASPIESGGAEQSQFAKRKLTELETARNRYRYELSLLKRGGRRRHADACFGPQRLGPSGSLGR